MKKQLSVLLSAMLLIGLASCGKKEKDPSLEGTWNVQKAVMSATKIYTDGTADTEEYTIDLNSEEAKAAQAEITLEITENTYTIIETSVNGEGNLESEHLGPFAYTRDGKKGQTTVNGATGDFLITKLTKTDLEMTLTAEREGHDYINGETIDYTFRFEYKVTAVRAE